MRNRELFPADRSLTVRMVLVSIITPLLVLALLAALFVVFSGSFAGGFAIVIALGVLAMLRDARKASTRVVLSERDAPDLFATVDRLCAVANVLRPEIVLEHGREPNSWVIAPPRRKPQLHVTQSLLDLLDPAELQAVLAHEISHVANRDATVMTVVGLPGAVLIAGSRRSRRRMGLFFWGLWLSGLIMGWIGKYSQLGTNTLSRYRELAADQGAAAITGRPSALASALIKVSGKMQAIPHTDLRAMAALDGFHFVAVGESKREGLLGRLGATHPSLEKRLRALEKLEEHAQHARPSLTD